MMAAQSDGSVRGEAGSAGAASAPVITKRAVVQAGCGRERRSIGGTSPGRPISRREFWELIYGMARDGVTVLVTTHYMDEAELCQRIGFISQGRLVAIDTPSRLKVTQMHGQVLEIRTPRPDRAMRALNPKTWSLQAP